ncbi:MAG: hypothetical protein B6D63_05740 [Candidatus Latescibacteria bacterium 4484_7]|nr:MAG: hypothetical protein B6D63_05740 [Candidatus Latescibacteria bacterium 4484_7]RKZ05760.1 MAG: hypothetical protein DRQ05_05880 [bacterium]
MTLFLQHAGLVLLYLLLFLSELLIFVGIPGGWTAFAIIFIYDAAHRFGVVGWKILLVMIAMLVIGEIIESFLGVVYVHEKGASRWGVLGAFIGGLGGAIAGSFVVSVAGSIIFGFVGAFALAVLFEYGYYRSAGRALQTGFFAFIGKLSAMFVKFLITLAILAIFIYVSWV